MEKQKQKELMLYFIDKAIEQQFKNAKQKTEEVKLYRHTIEIPKILRKAKLNAKLKSLTER